MAGIFRILVFGTLLLAVRALAADGPTPKFNVKTRKSDDSVRVDGDAGKVVFAVRSPSGIGSATVERTANDWPAGVTLRLHLSGLESLVVSNGKAALKAAVARHEGKLQARLWIDDKETEPLAPTSPYWMDIRILGADGKPASQLPLKNGHFEMTLPRAIFDGNPRSLSMQWIDFYRG